MTKITTPADRKTVPTLATGIDAVILGQSRRCEIHRNDLRYFEAIHGPALHLMNRIRDLAWDTEMIRSIIAFATDPRPKDGEAVESFRLAWLMSETTRRERSALIDEAFATHGPVRYSGLALGILGAALIGLPPESAVFDDEVTDA